MIRVSGLCKSFGTVRAVDGVSFEVERGEVVGFLGPNGAGKSTTMRLLVGCLHPDAGAVEIAGFGLGEEPLAAKRRLGYLPESTPLYRAMGVDEYLDFAARTRGMARAERRAALGRVRERCGLEGFGRRRIRELSKGYRQRVGLAQALVGDPEVLILDEPTSGLDPAEIVRIRALVVELGRERTVLLSTHLLAEVQETARRVLILAGGRVAADGSPLDLAEGEPAELLVTLRAGAGAARRALEELPQVSGVRERGSDAEGCAGFALAVADRRAAAEAVFALAAARGWPLSELRHELPSLETVFLRRTGSLGREPSSDAQASGRGARPAPEAGSAPPMKKTQ